MVVSWDWTGKAGGVAGAFTAWSIWPLFGLDMTWQSSTLEQVQTKKDLHPTIRNSVRESGALLLLLAEDVSV